jgi:Class II Aldolase and Adducin N-terminal domain
VPNKMTVQEAISMSVRFDGAAFACETLPTFDRVENDPRYRKQELALALRLFGKAGFGEDVAGHIAVLDRQNPQHVWVNPFGVSLRKIKPSDLLRVGRDGNIIDGNRPVNKAALCIHCEVHKARPDALAGAHAHSLHGKAFSNLHRLLDPLTQDALPVLRRPLPQRRLRWCGHRPRGGRADRQGTDARRDPRRATGPARLMPARLGRDRPRQPGIAAGG